MQEIIRIYYKDRQKHVDSQILISTVFIDKTNSDSKKKWDFVRGHYIKHSPSLESKGQSVGQEIPRLL